ncbi:hypothetical protein GUJ93_ZPchr0006g42679 [Zizania palustris]|uniref:Myb-like domain-containing protein n=1 Tax=Zizania palustris TaxID=103762 RepID=A0A8J5W1L3_ZIZPA|nr:hypothetical protein GUJ93_ZPchr0006g42679 [Zizania palustris]
MPPPSVSAVASRFAAYWVADALAGDESLDFSGIKALVGVSPDSLTGAPEAVRERVALRCLQEVASAPSEGEAAAAGMLRVDASRSCEDFLLELIGEVGSSGSLEKGMLLPFSQDIEKFICIKGPTLPETSFELLREVYPEITPVVPPSLMEQNSNDQHDNMGHDPLNTEKLGFATDGVQPQQDDLANLVDEKNTELLKKEAMPSTPNFHQPCTSDNRCFDPPQEDAIDAVGVNARSPEGSSTNVDKHMSVAAEPSLVSCADLLGNNTGKTSKQNTIDHTTMVPSQSCEVKNPNTLHYNNGDGPPVDVTCIQSSKDFPAFDKSNDALQASASETSHLSDFVTAEDTSITSESHIRKTHPSSPQHDNGYKANQNVDYDSAGIQSVGKDSDHDECTLQTAAVLPSEACNGAIQGDKSEIKDLPENFTEHTKIFEQEISDKAHLEAGCSDKANQVLYDDGNIMEKNTVCHELNVQTAPETRCSMAFHNKISESNHSSEQNIGKNTIDHVQKDCGSIPTSLQDVNETRAKQASSKKTMENTVTETSHVHSSDYSFSGFTAAGLLSMSMLDDTQDQDLCIKCGKDGQLLKCSSCLLAAHDSCFGSSVTFDDSGQFYCPVCFYTKAIEAYQKAKKTYSEARKNLSNFLGIKQLVKQHEQQTTVRQRAANSEDHLNGYNASKRQGNHQSEVDNLSNRDEEPVRQRKKQKTNPTNDACPQEVVTEKAPVVQNSDLAPTNKHSVLQNNRKRAQVSDHKQPEENAEACGESGNDDSSHKRRHSSQNKCSPAANQNVDAEKEDGHTGSHQSEDSDEIEATSSDGSSKQSSPPWRNLRHYKERYQDKDTAIPPNSKKALGHHDQHIASPSRKRNYAYQPKRYCNPVVPTGRRKKLCWTEQEEAALREAMTKFTPRDNEPIPWVRILEYGRDVFHMTRLPCDLRVKWRNMKKKPVR